MRAEIRNIPNCILLFTMKFKVLYKTSKSIIINNFIYLSSLPELTCCISVQLIKRKQKCLNLVQCKFN